MSPEQRSGSPVDKRSDLYSLAVVAYELLADSGERRQASDERVANNRHVYVIESLPKSLRGTFRKALSHSPEARFSTARRFVNAIQLAPARRFVFRLIFLGLIAWAVWWLIPWQRIRMQYLQYAKTQPLYSIFFAPDGNSIFLSGRGEGPLDVKLLGPCHVESHASKGNADLLAGRPNRVRLLATTSNDQAFGLSIEKSYLESSDGFTVSFWFLADSVSERSTLLHIGEASGYSNQAVPQITVWLSRDGTLNALSFWRYREVAANNPELNSTVEIGPCVGKWRHLVITFQPVKSYLENSGIVRIYVDGNPLIEREQTRLYLVLKNQKARLTLGRTLKSPDKGHSNGFIGELSDVQIWDWALTPERVRSISIE